MMTGNVRDSEPIIYLCVADGTHGPWAKSRIDKPFKPIPPGDHKITEIKEITYLDALKMAHDLSIKSRDDREDAIFNALSMAIEACDEANMPW